MTQKTAGGGTVSHPKVELRPLSALRPAERNARTHSDRQIAQITASIEQFGFTNPVLVDDGEATDGPEDQRQSAARGGGYPRAGRAGRGCDAAQRA